MVIMTQILQKTLCFQIQMFIDSKTILEMKRIFVIMIRILDFPGGSDSKASACNTGDPGLIPGSGRSPGEGNVNPLQYSCLENSMD